MSGEVLGGRGGVEGIGWVVCVKNEIVGGRMKEEEGEKDEKME